MIVEKYLDPKIIKNFRKLINSSNIFYEQNEHRTRWNLVCTLMDRIDSAINYLNSHSEQPNTEEEFIFQIVFACIIKDGVYKFYENIYQRKPSTILKKRRFSNAKRFSEPFFTKETCPTDDVFFEYLRSLAFAHPFGTSKNHCNKRIFMEKDEVNMSPWVFCNGLFSREKSVGLRIYTNADKEHDIIDLFFPYNNFKKYIKERYELIKEFISWGINVINDQNKERLKTKVNRSLSPISIVFHMKQILESRFVHEYALDDLIDILEFKTENLKNLESIGKIQKYLISRIEKMCDAVDSLDNETLEEELDYLYNRPLNLHNQAHYELEKIFSYLDDERGPCLPGSDEERGLIQAISFYKSYAYKYVFIDFIKMQYKEIKLLIRVSCILGYEEEKNGK